MTYFILKKSFLFAAAILIALQFSVHAQETAPADKDNSETEMKSEELSAAQPIKPNAVKELDELFDRLRKETKKSAAKATEQKIWSYWNRSGDFTIDQLMQWATMAMSDRRFAIAQDMLDQAIELKPTYAEAWNRRATMFYHMRDFSKSISDIEQTLILEPRHFGALSGLAAILQNLDQKEKALETWYRVLEIYPASEGAQKAVIDLEEALAGERT